MNFATSLYYVTHHSETIIQWLFLVILLLAGVVIARGLFAKKAPAEGDLATADTSELQAFLEKILERTSKLDAVAASNLTPATAAQVDEQIQILKKDLALREDEIQKLKTAGSPQASVDAGKVDARIKELEAKLAEYEILEDDIADLSLFKEENTRLKMELEKVKGSATTAPPTPLPAQPATAAAAAEEVADALAAAEKRASAPAPTAPSLTSPPPAASASGEEIVAEFAEAVTQETSGVAGEPLQAAATGNPMADFESAMRLEKKLGGGDTVASAAEPAAATASTVAESDDLFAEFASASPLTESVDTNKLVAEMDALTPADPATVEKALDETIDTDKLVLEANFGKS